MIYELPDECPRRIAFLINSGDPATKQFLLSLGPQFESEDSIYLSGVGLATSPGPITAAFANMRSYECDVIKSLKLAAESMPGSFDCVIIGDVNEKRLARTVKLLEDADLYGRQIRIVRLTAQNVE